MDIDLQSITLAALLTTAGSTSAAALITGLVAVLGSLAPGLVGGHEKQAAAILAALLVMLCAVQAVVTDTVAVNVTLILAVVFGWYAITRLSMSIYDDVANKRASLRAGDDGDPGDGGPDAAPAPAPRQRPL